MHEKWVALHHRTQWHELTQLRVLLLPWIHSHYSSCNHCMLNDNAFLSSMKGAGHQDGVGRLGRAKSKL
eukprot:1159585-Pelagomonas_calceolata.AAC.2